MICMISRYVEDIDHNPSSTAATSSFHGTSISIFHFTTPVTEEKSEN